MSASLGGLVKDYRLQKNISQLEIAFALGWKEPSRLSRIEQGRVEKPPRELLEKIMDAMRLRREERNHLLYVGNYVPTDKDIEEVKTLTDPVIQEWGYPVEVLDFTWRVVHENNASKDFYYTSHVHTKTNKGKPNVLEIIFSPDFPPNKNQAEENKKQWYAFQTKVLVQFQYAQRTRTKEKFYTELVGRMMKNPLFRELWLQAQQLTTQDIATNYGEKVFINPKNPKQVLRFTFFVVPMFKNPRFDIEFHVPADRETFEYFEK